MTSVRKKNVESRTSVVLVDDERSYVELMAQMLTDNLECEVHMFTSPEEALSQLADLSAGVIVSDYFMPELDGVEFIRRATAIAPGAAFIIVSGHDLGNLEHELAELKMLKLRLQKPFGWRPLAAAVIEAWPGKDAPAYKT